jgi:hypothetical protein
VYCLWKRQNTMCALYLMVCELLTKCVLFCVICCNRYLLLSDLLFPFVICSGTCTHEYWSNVQWKGNSFNWSSLEVANCQIHTQGYNVCQYCRSLDSLSQWALLAGSLCQDFTCEAPYRDKKKMWEFHVKEIGRHFHFLAVLRQETSCVENQPKFLLQNWI